jgi:hypothetical protein
VTVPAGCPLVVVEGVGIGRRDLARFFDALVWVQTNRVLAAARGLARDADRPDAEAFWLEWEAAERPFLAATAHGSGRTSSSTVRGTSRTTP